MSRARPGLAWPAYKEGRILINASLNSCTTKTKATAERREAAPTEEPEDKKKKTKEEAKSKTGFAVFSFTLCIE